MAKLTPDRANELVSGSTKAIKALLKLPRLSGSFRSFGLAKSLEGPRNFADMVELPQGRLAS